MARGVLIPHRWTFTRFRPFDKKDHLVDLEDALAGEGLLRRRVGVSFVQCLALRSSLEVFHGLPVGLHDVVVAADRAQNLVPDEVR